MRRIAFRQFLCLFFMLVLSMGRVFSQNVVDLGTNLYSTKYYESMNAANPPSGEWYAVDYDDSGWNTYTNSMDYPEYDAFWVRRTFIITDNPANHTFQLKIAHDSYATFYVNGQQIHSDWGCGRYCYYDVPSSYLVCGINVLSIYAYDDDGGSRYLECVISTSDGSNIVVDCPTEPMLFLSESELRLYMVEGYSDLSLNAQLVAPSGLIDSQYSWTSSNPDVVSVINGQLEALSAGNAVVTATTTYNGVSYSNECEVEVRAIKSDTKVVFVDVPGTLGSLLTDDEKESIDDLTLFGKLDGNDIQVLRYMAGRNEKGNRTPGVLADLDIYNVEFVTGNKGSFQINNDNSSYIETGKLPWGIFRNCATLNTVVLPRTVSQIGSEAFRECTNLLNVEIPDNITEIYDYAFYGCNNLKTVEFPASIVYIGYEAFATCRKLESVLFADGIKLSSIQNWAFHNTNIRSLTIPASVTSIGNYSFHNIENLVSVDFEAGSQLVELKPYSFASCYNLQSIELPEGCLEIGDESFYNCYNLTSISIPASLVSLGNSVFRYCNSLTTIDIPQNSKLTSIGSYAFDGTNVTSFYIPKGLTSISDIFSNTSRLQSLTVHPDNRYYESVGGIVYGKRDHSVVLVPKSIDGYLTFPDYVTTIPENLLQGCSRLKGLILHSGITNLGENAFSGCSGLQTLMNLSATPATISSESLNGIDKSVVTLVVPQGSVSAYASAEGWSEFENIVEVSDVPTILLSTNDVMVYDVSYESARTSTVSATVITKDGIAEVPVAWATSDSSVATVNNGVIEYAGEGSTTVIASVTVGEYTSTASCNVTSVGMSNGKMVFVEKAGDLSTMLTDAEKDDLTHLIVMGSLNSDDIRVLRYMAGRDEFGNMTVGSLEVLDMGKAKIVSGGEGYYYENSYWRGVSDDYFNSYIFRSCNSLKKIVLPSSLTRMESYAFSDCSNLEEVVLPDGLTYIGYECFRNCGNLKKINIPSSVTNLSSWIFYGCSSLKTIDLSTMTGVSMIPEYMFYASGLTSVRIPANITNIGNNAFYNTPLKSVVFDNDSRLATISECAFQSTKLQSITIPASVTSIGNYAFDNCSQLTSVSYSENNKLTTLGENVFRGCPINTFLIPKKLISMGSQDFADSITIVVEDGNKFFEAIDGVLYTHSDNSLVYAPKDLTSIYLPDFVVRIKDGALRYHYNLKTLVLTSAFTDLGDSPFMDDYNLKEVYCMNTTPPTVRSLTNGWGERVYIPVGSKNAYEDANWPSWLLEERSYSNSVALSASSLTLYSAHGGNSAVLTSDVFSDNGPVQYSSVTWSSSNDSVATVDSIGHIKYVGPGSAVITASTILGGTEYTAECHVTSIGTSDPDHTYYLTGDGNLRSMIGEENKYTIEKLVLVGKLADDDRNFIREMTFNRYENGQYVTGALKCLDMSELVDTVIESSAFSNCESLETVILPDNCKELGTEAFAYCSNLSSLIVPASTVKLNWGALRACTRLKYVEFLGMTAPQLADYVFGEIGTNYCVIVPTGSKGYMIDDNWNMMSNVYEKGSLPVIVLQESGVNLYNINQAGVNEIQLNAYAITTEGVNTSEITWVSSDTAIASVSTNGILKYVGTGVATITASITNDGKTVSAECEVTTKTVADPTHAYYLTGQGNLRSLISEDDKYNVERLVLVGKLTDDDRNFIREMAFNRYENGQKIPGALKYLDMSELVDTVIESSAFSNCESLETVILPNNCKELGTEAFAYCSNLSSLIVPASTVKLNWGALRACTGLKSVEFLGMTAPQLADYVFGEIGTNYCVIVPTGSKGYMTDENWNMMSNVYEKGSLPVIVLQESGVNLYNINQAGVNEIQLNAYAITTEGVNTSEITWVSSDTAIASVSTNGLLKYVGTGVATITASITNDGKTVSAECEVTTKAVADPDHAYYLTGRGNLRSLIREGDKYNIEKLVLVGKLSSDDRNFIREIARNRYVNGQEVMGSLKHLDMSELEDTVITSSAFSECRSLETVVLPKNTKIIENDAFAYCTSISSLMIPEGVTELGWGALYGCTGLNSVLFLSMNAPQLSDNVFGGINTNYCIIVPSGATDYKIKSYWKNMTNIYEADILPIFIMKSSRVELYNVDMDGANSDQLNAYVITWDGIKTDGIIWTTSDSTIVTVSVDGLIKAGATEGEAVVTVSYTDNGKTITSDCKVSVVDVSDYKIVNVATAGTLSDLLTEEEKYDTKKLIVSGNLNSDDIRVLRYMAGRDENGNVTAGSLEVLNMNKAKIVYGGEGYYYENSWWREVSENSFSSYIFRSCNSLRKIVLPSSLSNLESYAFYECQNLEEVILPDGLTSIGYEAFGECRKLSKVNIPSSVTNLSSWVFYGCSNLKTIDLTTMTGVNRIPEYMFYYSGLTTVRIPANITNINNYAFQETSLKSLEFEEGSKLATIGNGAFRSTKLQSVTIPASVTSISNYAFSDCRQLINISYAENNKLTSLGDNVFDGCPIDTFFIPKRLISMGIQNFPESMSVIVVEEGNKFFETIDGALYCKSDNSLIYVPKDVVSLFLPEYVTTLKAGVLQSHYNLRTVVLTSVMSNLGDYPFSSSYNLREVYCMNPEPPTMRYITSGWNGKIYIPVGSREDYEDAGWESSWLEERSYRNSITISDTEMKLYNAIGGNNYELSSSVFSENGPVMSSSVVWSSSDTSVVSVNAKGQITYTGPGTATVTASVVLNGSNYSAECDVTSIQITDSENAYYLNGQGNLRSLISMDDKYNIEKLVLVGTMADDDRNFIREMSGNRWENEMTVTGKLAFLDMELLTDTIVGSCYLEGCNSLTSVILPKNTVSIGYRAFSNCTNLTSIQIPASAKTIGDEAFYYCSNLESIQLPISVSSIGSGAFNGCSSLEIFQIPDSIKTIEQSTFYGCSSLKTIQIPAGVSSIEWGAFYYCSNLRVLRMLGNEAPDLRSSVFEGIPMGALCVIVPSGSTGYQTKNNWKNMTNIYEEDVLPMMVISKKSIELYSLTDTTSNSEKLSAYAITLDGITTSGISWISSDTTIATVSQEGQVFFDVTEGEVTITASYTEDEKTVSSSCKAYIVDISDYKIVNVADAGTLSSLLTEEEKFDTKKLIVTGNLNSDDIRVLRYMAGRDENGNVTAGSLEVLNISKAKIVSGGDGYYYQDGWWRNVSDNYFGSEVFSSCNSLKKIVLPSSLYSIEYNAFYGCTNLEEVVLPEGLNYIGSSAFSECRKLSKVNIPSSVTSISNYIFSGCISLKSIDLSTMTGINRVPDYMFYRSGIMSVIIPAHITNINNGAFYETPLKTVSFEEGSKLATIGNGAFQSTKLQSITIPASVTSIGNYAFNNCNQLKDVIYAEDNKLSSLGNNVYDGCPIDTFFIPKRLLSMGSQNFSECQILVEEGNKFFESIDGVLCSKSDNSLLYVPVNKSIVYLPDYVTNIANGAVRYHNNLSTLVLSTTISDLGESPFCGSYGLSEIYCMNPEPPTVRYLTNGWSGKVYIPVGSRKAYIEADWDSTMLVERMFDYSITLSTSNIKLYNVTGGNKRGLSALLFTPTGPTMTGIEWSSDNPSVVSVDNHGIISYVDEGEAVITARAVFEDTILTAACRVNNIELDANSNVYYVTAGNLSTLIPEERKYDITDLILLGEINADDIRFIREMAGIDNNNNKTEGKLARLNMEAVNVVYGGSYWSCRWGTSYNDDNKLGAYAFADCKSLEEVILPSNLTSLRSGVFYECDKLRNVTLPSLISSIPQYTFYNCKSLTNVYIPENVSYIYYEAFAYCTSLKSVISLCTIPASMDWSSFNGLTKGNITLLIPAGTMNDYSKADYWKEFKTITEMDQLPMLILGYNSLSLYNFNSLGASDRTIPATVITKYGVSDAFVTWKSSNPDVVTVNNGYVAMTTVPGTSVITATAIVDSDTLTAICNVTTNFIDADNAYFVEAGNLPNLIPEEQKDSITKLVLFGELNGTDIRYIREMAGISEYYWGNPGNGTLEYLDLSNATIVSGGRDYGEAQYVYNDNGDWSSRWEYTENDVIGNGMFRKSNSLKTIILPNNIKKIGSYAFDECPKLEEVLNMPSTVTELSSRALYGFDVVYTSNTTPMDLENSSLLSDGSVIVVPATSLDAYRTADNWKEFKTQIIPDNIQTTVSLVVTAEEKNSGLLTAAGSDENLSYIMDLTLSGTINGYDIGIIRNRMPILRNLDLSNVRIVANPFKYYLDSHTENNRLGNDAFREMNKLRRVVLPKTIDYIGANAFSDCENLSSIKMFEGLNTIDYYAFANCRNLIDVELPEGLLSIGNGAFSSCNRMETISLPNSLLSIGSSAFSNCYSLKSIVLPKNVSRIDWETFWYCTSLESVVLPAKVNRIEYYAFYGCSKLKELRLPPMIESIGDRAFYDCGNIKDVYVYIANSKDIRIDQNTFSCWKTATLHIPTFSYESYYWDTQWMQFYEKVEFQDTYDEFYTKNTLELNTKTGVIEGDPNAVLYEQGGLVVDDIEQVLDEVELKSDGTDGASLIASGEGSIKASKLIININVSAYRWHFFCFPFDIPLDSMKYDGEYVWRQYDGEARSRREGGWQDLAAGTTVLSKGRGYIFQGTITGSLSFTITNPDLSAKDETTGLFTHESQNAQDANWNFVGNPYTSYFNIDETSYSAPITVWTGYGYEAYRPGDDDYDLAPYQAFFVQTPDNTDEINFNADGRESYEDKEAAQSGRQAARRAAAREQVASGRLFINLEITADGESSYADKTRVVFNDSKSMDYEQNCDAAKFFSDASTIELYSVDANGAKYSINERPVGDGTVELGIKVNTADTYTIKAVRMDTPVLLFDKELNVTYDLSEGGYTFWTDKCESQRFVLKTSDTSLTKVLEVKNGAEQEDKIYDLQGRQLDDADAKGVIIINGKKVLGNN